LLIGSTIIQHSQFFFALTRRLFSRRLDRRSCRREGIETIADLKPGMQLEGVVTNVAAFGAFVDVGVHQDGLVHISELADRFVKDPREVVKAWQPSGTAQGARAASGKCARRGAAPGAGTEVTRASVPLLAPERRPFPPASA
jgi:hypothetical protein